MHGRLIWNRQRFVKDPETGKRQARPNPPVAWLTEAVPHLRIIDGPQWQRVKVRQGAIRADIIAARDDDASAPKAELGRRARHLFSGTLECGCVGNDTTYNHPAASTPSPSRTPPKPRKPTSATLANNSTRTGRPSKRPTPR